MPVVLARKFGGPRTARPGEGARLLAFLDRTFVGGCPDGMAAEYPHLYGAMERRLGWCHVITHAGRIVAHVGVYPLEFVTHGRRVRVGGIGAVATLPAFRGQGLMSRLLEHATGVMRREGMPLSILWGDRARYARFGWEACGAAFRFRVYPGGARAALGRYRGRVVALADPGRRADELHALQRRLPLRVERDPEEFRLVLKKVRRQVFAAMAGSRIGAWIQARRWTGRHGTVWSVQQMAGSGEGLASILRHLALMPRTHNVEGQVPLTWQPVLAPLLNAQDAWSASVGTVGQIKVVDRGAALAALGATAVTRPLARLRLDPLAETRLLFGPLAPDVVLPPGKARGPLARALPLPLYLWPADHV